MKNYIFTLAIFIGTSLIFFSSCREGELDAESIFGSDEAVLDTNSYTYLLDQWLYDNYQETYNLKFRYRMEDVGADMNYNLIPTRYDKSIDMAVLAKYLWFDVYAKVVRPDFLKEYGPRIIHLIGSPAYNPRNHTMILGLAEGGIKVSLFRCNQLNVNSVNDLNEMYFKTMHHEFAHILHQTKSYPKTYNTISANFYQPFSWQDRDYRVAASLGFVSQYAGNQSREDFVEVIANFIVKTDEQWAKILYNASKGWKVELDKNGNPKQEQNEYGEWIDKYIETPGVDADGIDGKAIIEQKLFICKKWLRDEWQINLDTLRAEVQYRQSHIDMDSLRNQLNYPK